MQDQDVFFERVKDYIKDNYGTIIIVVLIIVGVAYPIIKDTLSKQASVQYAKEQVTNTTYTVSKYFKINLPCNNANKDASMEGGADLSGTTYTCVQITSRNSYRAEGETYVSAKYDIQQEYNRCESLTDFSNGANFDYVKDSFGTYTVQTASGPIDFSECIQHYGDSSGSMLTARTVRNTNQLISIHISTNLKDSTKMQAEFDGITSSIYFL